MCKVIISDECQALLGILKEKYSQVYHFLCGLHKMKNIQKNIKKH